MTPKGSVYRHEAKAMKRPMSETRKISEGQTTQEPISPHPEVFSLVSKSRVKEGWKETKRMRIELLADFREMEATCQYTAQLLLRAVLS